MKNNIFLVLIGLIIIPNITNANYVPVFACNSQCVAIDWDRKIVNNLGVVSGDSEYSDQEAFLDMKENCQKKIKAAGVVGEGQMAKKISASSETQLSQYSSSQSSQVSELSGAAATRWGLFSKRIAIAFHSYNYSEENNVYIFNTIDQFSFSIDPSEAKDCEMIRVNPNGTPKYVGPGTPLG